MLALASLSTVCYCYEIDPANQCCPSKGDHLWRRYGHGLCSRSLRTVVVWFDANVSSFGLIVVILKHSTM